MEWWKGGEKLRCYWCSFAVAGESGFSRHCDIDARIILRDFSWLVEEQGFKEFSVKIWLAILSHQIKFLTANGGGGLCCLAFVPLEIPVA